MRTITYREALRESLRQEMERDERVFLIGEEIGRYGGAFKVTEGLLDEFGESRVIDTPISEAAIIGAAVGAAMMGMRPVAEIMYEDMIAVGMDQLVSNAAKMRYVHGGLASVPMVLRAAYGAGGNEGVYFAQSLEAWFAHVPGLKVVMPSDAYDAKGLLTAAIQDPDPVLVLEHKMLYPKRSEVPVESYAIPIGSACVKRPGRDLTVVATGAVVAQALAIGERLAGSGFEIEVIDLRTISPLDSETIVNSVRRTHRLVIAHEACQSFGVGAEIAAVVAREAFAYLDSPIERVAGPDTPVPFSPALEAAYMPSQKRLLQVVSRMLDVAAS